MHLEYQQHSVQELVVLGKVVHVRPEVEAALDWSA